MLSKHVVICMCLRVTIVVFYERLSIKGTCRCFFENEFCRRKLNKFKYNQLDFLLYVLFANVEQQSLVGFFLDLNYRKFIFGSNRTETSSSAADSRNCACMHESS